MQERPNMRLLRGIPALRDALADKYRNDNGVAGVQSTNYRQRVVSIPACWRFKRL